MGTGARLWMMFNEIWREVQDYDGSEDLLEQFREAIEDVDDEIEGLQASLNETTDLLADCEAEENLDDLDEDLDD